MDGNWDLVHRSSHGGRGAEHRSPRIQVGHRTDRQKVPIPVGLPSLPLDHPQAVAVH